MNAIFRITSGRAEYNNINLIHKGRAKVSVSVKCLVLVKMFGNNPRKLSVRVMRNSDVRMNEFPLFSFPFLRIVFISWCSLFISSLTVILFRDGVNQILDGISKSPVVVLVQFSGRNFGLSREHRNFRTRSVDH